MSIQSHTYNDEQLHRKIEKMAKFCSANFTSDPINLFERPRWSFHRSYAHLGLKTLKKICEETNREALLKVDTSKLLLCGANLSRHFLNIHKTNKYGKVNETLKTLVFILSPEKLDEAIDTFLTFIVFLNLWKNHHFVVELLNTVLNPNSADNILNKLLDMANSKEWKSIYNVVCCLMKKYQWSNKMTSVQRLRNLYFKSVKLCTPQESVLSNCFKSLCAHMKNFDLPDFIIESLQMYKKVPPNISRTLEYAVKMCKIDDLQDLSNLIDIIFEFIKSDDGYKFALGCKLFKNFIDKNDNRSQIDISNYFYVKYSRFNCELVKYSTTNDHYLYKFVEDLFQVLLRAIIINGKDMKSAIDIFLCASLAVVNLSCDAILIGAVSFCLGVQKYASKSCNGFASHRLQALVGSLLSLIGRSQVSPLLEYVKNPLLMRAKYAPHLNPPLCNQYEYNYNSITWFDHDFYFQEYFIRQALWKHFHS